MGIDARGTANYAKARSLLKKIARPVVLAQWKTERCSVVVF
jgi:hypothetical protein